MKRPFVLFLLLNFVFAAAVGARSAEFLKILDTTRQPELWDADSHVWKPLPTPYELPQGSKIRTRAGSSVEIAFDAKLENMAEVRENSMIKVIQKNPARIFLESGSFFILREENEKDGVVLKTRHAEIRMRLGGCAVSESRKGTLVRVFSEEADVSNLTVKEGFWVLVKPGGRITKPRRMQYEDYRDWQVWIHKFYERKDKLAWNSIEKIIERHS